MRNCELVSTGAFLYPCGRNNIGLMWGNGYGQKMNVAMLPRILGAGGPRFFRRCGSNLLWERGTETWQVKRDNGSIYIASQGLNGLAMTLISFVCLAFLGSLYWVGVCVLDCKYWRYGDGERLTFGIGLSVGSRLSGIHPSYHFTRTRVFYFLIFILFKQAFGFNFL